MEGCKGDQCELAHADHSIACHYQRNLTELGLKDSPELRVLFWATYGVTRWDEHHDKAMVPPFAANQAAMDETLREDGYVTVPRSLLGAAASAINHQRAAPEILAQLRLHYMHPHVAQPNQHHCTGSNPCHAVLEATGSLRRLTLTGKELVDLVNFTCPDYHSDPDQLNTGVVLQYHEATPATPEVEAQAAGIYVSLSEYPEEGAYGPVGTLTSTPSTAP